jgi:hypothetical protein
MTHAQQGNLSKNAPDPKADCSPPREVEAMKILVRIPLVIHVIILLWAWFLQVDLIQSDSYSPYYQYVRINEIRTVLYAQLLVYTLYLLYWIRFFMLFRVRYLYSESIQTFVALSWVTLVVALKVVEVLMRSGYYYGEVRDKHGDWGIILILIYPILWLVYYLSGRDREMGNLAKDSKSSGHE